MRNIALITLVFVVVLLLLAGAGVFNKVLPTNTVDAESEAELTNLGSINGVVVIRVQDGSHICYIAANDKWNNVTATIDCPE